MSRASDYARDVSSLLTDKANAIAEGKRTSGQIIGSTIATLGQVIPQQVQAAMHAAAQKRKEAQIQGIFQKYPGDLGAAINEIMPIDQKLGNELLERHTQAQKLALEYKNAKRQAETLDRKFIATNLGSARDQDSHTQALLTLREGGIDISQFDPEFNPKVADGYMRAGMDPDKLYELEHPKPQALMAVGGGAVFDPNTKTTVRQAELTPDQVADNERMAAGEARQSAAQAETVRHNQEMERIGGMTAGRQAAAAAETARHNRAMEARPVGGASGGGGGATKIPDPYKLALGRATLNLPNVRRGNVSQTAEMAYAQGGEKALADVVREAAIEGEPVAARDRIMGRMSTIAALNDAKAIMLEMQKKGVPTNILRGSMEDVARKLGTSTNTDYVKLATLLNTVMINYRRSITGAAFGQQEGADYERLFPNYKNTLPVNVALIDGLGQQMASYDKSYWNHKLGPEGAQLMGVLTTGGGVGAATAPRSAPLAKPSAGNPYGNK